MGVPLRATIVVLVSGAATNLQALLDACAVESYGVRVGAVGSDRDAPGLERAGAAGVPTFVIRPGCYPSRGAWDEALADAVARYAPDLVVFAGFMRVVGAGFVRRFPDRILNTHPALLPAFPGAHPVRDTLAHGVTVTGVTVHLVDVAVDSGPIVAQRTVPVYPDDVEKGLHERIKTVERALLVETVGTMVRSGYRVEGRKVLMRNQTGD